MQKIVEIKKSRNGKGIFACRRFYPEEIIFEIKGKIITCNEDDELEESVRDNTFRFSKEKYLSPQGEMGDFLNHSCSPNSKIIKIKNKLFIQSIKNIKKSEEILFDYSTILGSDDMWQMECNCGNEECRGAIKNFESLPKRIKDEYRARKMVPKYVLG